MLGIVAARWWWSAAAWSHMALMCGSVVGGELSQSCSVPKFPLQPLSAGTSVVVVSAVSSGEVRRVAGPGRRAMWVSWFLVDASVGLAG